MTLLHASTSTAVPGPRTPCGPRGHLLLGHVRELQHDALNFYISLARDYGDVARVRLLSRTTYVVSHPDGIRQILQKQHLNYDRKVFLFQPLRPFLGNGLSLSDGALWRQQRRLMQPAFHRQRITSLATQMTAAITALFQRWESRSNHDEPLNLHQEMMRLTLCIAGLTLFGLDLSDEHNPVGRAFQTMVHALAEYVFFPFPPLGMPTPRNRRIRAALRTLDTLVHDLVRQRREQRTDMGDLLSMLLLAQDEEGQGMSDQQLRDEIMALLFAGHETTANTLTWACSLLAAHPESQHRLFEEVETVLQGEPPTVEHLSRLVYTRMVLDETLRLYPSSFALVRRTRADETIRGYRIPARHIVWTNIYAAHHDPAYWEQPEVFDPERFSPDHQAQGVREAYFPFGGGPHLCIGNSFALMEGQLVLAMLAQSYRLQLASGQTVEPMGNLTIRPRDGLSVLLKARH
ncbi:MAG TPA: cytochrome P450 [Ktedonobacteraceae bacterium]